MGDYTCGDDVAKFSIWLNFLPRAHQCFQNSREAMRAPSAIAAIFAHTTSGSTAACPTHVPKPQSLPAITFSLPTSFAYRPMRCAMSSGCSMKFDFDSITPGMSSLPSGSLSVSNSFHSCAWRGLAASSAMALGRARNTMSITSAKGTSQ